MNERWSIPCSGWMLCVFRAVCGVNIIVGRRSYYSQLETSAKGSYNDKLSQKEDQEGYGFIGKSGCRSEISGNSRRFAQMGT